MNWHEYFTYNPETGDLIWKERPRESFPSANTHSAFNSNWSGKIAGHKFFNENGSKKSVSLCVFDEHRIKRKRHQVHRIIWEMHYGPIPKGIEVDHFDADPFNNRILNLRLATPRQNQQNTTRRVSKYGVRGVSYNGVSWVAYGKRYGKSKHLGAFTTKGLAALFRAKYELRVGGKFSVIYRNFILRNRASK